VRVQADESDVTIPRAQVQANLEWISFHREFELNLRILDGNSQFGLSLVLQPNENLFERRLLEQCDEAVSLALGKHRSNECSASDTNPSGMSRFSSSAKIERRLLYALET
jgi:hypothetical protein